MKRLLITVVITLIGFNAEAKTVYVNNTMGDDRFTGEREDFDVVEAGPVRTIKRATELARLGDTISLADTGVPYQECVSLTNKNASGINAEYPFILEGNGASLDGRVTVEHEKWEHFKEIYKNVKDNPPEYQGDIFRLHVAKYYPNAVCYCMLFVDAMPIQNKSAEPMESPVGQLNELDAALFEGYLYFRPEKGKTPEDYKLEITALRTGITLNHVDHVVIRNLIVQGFQLDGVSLANSATNVVIEQCTIRGNARAGMAVGWGSDVKASRILMCANAFSEVLTLPYSRVKIEKSRLSGDYGKPWIDQSGTEHGSAALFSNNGKWITPEELRPDLSPLPDAQNAVKEFEDDADADDADAGDAADDADNDDVFSIDDDSDKDAAKDDSDKDDDDFGLGGDDSSKDDDNPFDEEKNDFGSVLDDDSEDDSDNPFDVE
jgi:hypothetical protein